MPFIKQHISQLERSDFSDDDTHSLNHHDDEITQSGALDSSMLVEKSRASTPLIPARSTMRASRMMQGLQLHDAKATTDLSITLDDSLSGNDPHEMYLSSEEDGSESADESDGSDASYVELDAEFLTASNRSSFEETAKTIAFVFSGKAQVIDVFSTQPEIVTSITTPKALSRRPSLFRSNTSKSARSFKGDSRRPSSSSVQSSVASTIFTDAGSAADPVPSLTASHSQLSFASIKRSRSKSQASSRRLTISPYPKENAPEVLTHTTNTPVPEQQATRGRWGLGTRKRPSMPFLAAHINSSRDLLDDSEVTTRSLATDSIAEDTPYIPTAMPSTKPAKSGHKKNRLSLNLSSLSLIAALEKSEQTSTKRESGIQSAIEPPTGYPQIESKGSDNIITKSITVAEFDSSKVNSPVRSQTTGDLNRLLNKPSRPDLKERSGSNRGAFRLFGSWGKSSARV